MPDIADADIEALRLYTDLCGTLKITRPPDEKVIGLIKKAFLAHAVRTIDEINTDIVRVKRKENADADRWQEVSVCDKITDALALKTKALRKELQL